MYEKLRTHLWSLFNKLSMDAFNPTIKKGVAKMPTFKPWKEEGRIDKKTYKVLKPDIEHIEQDNLDTADLTSDSESEDTKERNLEQIIKFDPKAEVKLSPLKWIKDD